MQTLKVTRHGKDFHFMYDPQTDDPAEGATLTAVIKDGRRIAPSGVPTKEIPYDFANHCLISKDSSKFK